MAEKLGEAVLELRTDDSKLNDGIDKARGRAEGLAGDFDRIGKRAREVGGKLTLGLTVPLGAFGTAAFKAATDAQELQSAFDQTFGNMAGEMNAWAEATGNAMGRSTQAIQTAANTLGIFFNQAAPTRREAAEMSKTFAVLAQDLSSFYNVSESDALAKLRSGLSGETEPLRDFGVFLTEAAVKAQAMEMGLAGVGNELTEQEKIMARAALILEQTKNAQGDVARTSGSTANQLRAANAAWEEMQVELGTKLLPVLTPLITKFAELLGSFTSLPDGVQTFVLAVGGIATVIGPALMGIGGLASGFSAMLPVITALGPVIGTVSTALLGLLANPIVLAAAAVIAGIYLAWQNWDKIAPIIDAVAQAVSGWWNDNVKPVLDFVLEKLRTVADFFRDYFGAQIEGVVNVVSALLRGDFAGAWAAAKEAVSKMVSAALTLLQNLVPGAVEAVRNLYLGVKQWVQDRLSAVFDWLKGKLEAVGGWFFDLYDKVVGHSYVPDMVNGIAQHFNRLGPEMADPAQQTTGQVAQSFADMAQNVESSIGGIVDKIKKGDFLGALQDAIGLIGQLGGLLSGAGAGGVGGFLSGIAGTLGGIFGTGSGSFAGMFASGGLIPNGTFGIVGERGPEPVIGTSRGAMVLPNRSLRQDGLGGGVTINFNGPVSNPEQVRRSAAQAGAAISRAVASGQRGI